ncbi:MAG TPA: phage tail sheath C-terminal domain-containing protein [Polyangiaceae bacterium]|nr:phage tail sheath C-terminal domain-containing protein [Polyangiaceae bacterium]
MFASLAPGLYRVPSARPHPTAGLVRTDIAGFVGMAERGPLDRAVRLTTWEEYRRTFGGFQRFGYLPYAVRGFFENGGDTCYVVRVARGSGPPEALPAVAALTIPGAPAVSTTLAAAAPKGRLTLELSTAPSWTHGQLVGVSAKGRMLYATLESVSASTLTLSEPLEREADAGDAVVIHHIAFRLEASSAGSWGNRIRVQVTPLEPGVLDLSVTLLKGAEGGPPQREYLRRLSWGVGDERALAEAMASGSNFVRVMSGSVDAAQALGAGLMIGSGPASNGHLGLPELRLSGGRDGLDGMTHDDYVGVRSAAKEAQRGLLLLEDVEEVAIVALPDAVYQKPALPPPQPPASDPCAEKKDPEGAAPAPDEAPGVAYQLGPLYRELLAHCARMRYCVAVLDAPPGVHATRLPAWTEANLRLRSKESIFGALYFPWLETKNPLADGTLRRVVPPSGHVAGSYARSDLAIGTHRAPAGGELDDAVGVTVEVDDEGHGALNSAGIDVLRQLPGRGIRVWGARSITQEPAWRFIHVRRFMSCIERSVEIAMRWAVFESNDFSLQRTLVHVLTVLLDGIWREGGFKGTTREQAFYVKCDATNNPVSVVDAGQLVCEIGVAIAAPMEFIVFEVRADARGTEVLER